jgi:hypothetical protein
MCKHYAHKPPANVNTLQAQQSWRSVATACRESSATVSECVSGLGLALSKLGSSRQQLLDGGLEADAVDEVRVRQN